MQQRDGGNLSRRSFVSKVSTGAAALVAVSASSGTAKQTQRQTATQSMPVESALGEQAQVETPNTQASAPPPWQLLQPLRAGSDLAEGWSVKDLGEIAEGSCVLTLTNQRGRTSRLHICRNDGSPEGLVYTDRLDIVVMNGGRGDMPTEEGLGQAVAKVAHVLAANEKSASSIIQELMPQNQRLAMFADTARLR